MRIETFIALFVNATFFTMLAAAGTLAFRLLFP